MSLLPETGALLLVIFAILALVCVTDLPRYLVYFWKLLGPILSGIKFVEKLKWDIFPFLKALHNSPGFPNSIKLKDTINDFLKDSEEYVLLLSACLLGHSNIPWSCIFLLSAIQVRDQMEDPFTPWKSWDGWE